MKTNLTARTVVIVVTILVCIYGIIGVPKSKAELVQNLKNNIRLGLDLKGGSHLVLEVQVQDAVKADADQTIERMKEDLKKQNIAYASMDRNDPQTVDDADNVQITIKGVPATQTSAFRSLVTERYPTYVLTAAEFHRLHHAAEAVGPDRAEARHGAAHHGHHQQPHQPAGRGRIERAAIWPRRRGLRNSGAVAGRGRSGAGEGTDRHGGRARRSTR